MNARTSDTGIVSQGRREFKPSSRVNVHSRARCASRLAAITDTRLSPDARLVYMLLDDYAGLKGIAWPKQPTLASRLGISLRKVQAAMKQLAATGWLRIERTGRASRCHLRWAWVSDSAPAATRNSVYEPGKQPEVSTADDAGDQETVAPSETPQKPLRNLTNHGWVDRHEVRRRELLEGMALISSIMARGQGHGIARPRKKSES
jgi:hypothetical protein